LQKFSDLYTIIFMVMKRHILFAAFLATNSLIFSQSQPAKNLFPNPGFELSNPDGSLQGWKTSSPRQEIAPDFATEKSVTHSGKSSACISAKGSKGTYGFFSVAATGLQPGSSTDPSSIKGNTINGSEFLSSKSYVVGCYYKTEGILYPERNVRIKLTWHDSKGKDLFTEFLSSAVKENGWMHVEQVTTAPRHAASATINLILQWTGSGKVWWDDVSLTETASPQPRNIKVAASTGRPKSPSTTEANLKYYADKITEAGKLGVDLLCLGEGITVVSTSKSYAEAAETIPGPTSKALGEAAKKAGTWVVAGIYEREGSLIYNTAILIDRQGNVAGKYRKVHLPQTEVEGGLTPGEEYPVFSTDFGTIGIEICYDNFFPEEVRSLKLNGAEIILLPIWGDIRGNDNVWDIVARARSIDNSVFLVASMYDGKGSLITDPNGNILQNSDNKDGLLTARIDLNNRTFERYLSVKSFGEWRNLMPQERRGETYFRKK
jgi:predicted amidohydrolase